MKRLSEDEQRRLNDDGYLFPISVLSAAEVSLYRNAFRQVESAFKECPHDYAYKRLHLYYRWAYDLVTHPKILDVIEDVLGPDIIVHSSSVFPKPPHSDDYVSWHQDGYYWQLDQPVLTSAWVALSESSPANGCMQVIPGTHRERLDHCEEPHGNNLLSSGLTLKAGIDPKAAVDVWLKPGELSLHNVNVLHGSLPNHSDTERLGFAIRYSMPSVSQLGDPVPGIPAKDVPVVLARGRNRWTHYREISEAPGTDFEHSLARHRESLFASGRATKSNTA